MADADFNFCAHGASGHKRKLLVRIRLELLMAPLAAGLAFAASAVGIPSAAGADAVGAGDALDLHPVVVTATRTPEPSLDLPMAIASVARGQISDGQPQVNLSESLVAVPGVSVENRQNYAQDLQMSIRGFGARSSFGVSGLRLYSDGIPGTMPDGQGQFSQFDLGSAGRIEVLRGPFSALYGNSSGGVIALFTEDGPPGNVTDASAAYGSFATQRYALKDAGDDGSLNYAVDAAHFQTDGYRLHSEAERNNFNTKLRFDLQGAGTLTLVGNAIQTPSNLDPLGLTGAQLAANRTQAGIGALAYDTRKSLSQEQSGAIYDRSLGRSDVLTASLYAGHRATTQFQAIPEATERPPSNPGGVIDLSRNFWGIDVHTIDHHELFGGPLQSTVGLSYEDLEEARRGYLNYLDGELGVEGTLRRDQANHVYDADEYLQLQWDPSARWRLVAGVRNSFVGVSSHDHLDLSGDPDSGVHYSAVDPVAGITYEILPALHSYASYGRGFETPTLNNLAYRSTNPDLTGLNLGLQPARSNNVELGLKAGESWLRTDADVFLVHTEHELAVLANADGRSVYENIGTTERRGFELGADALGPHGLSARLAYTYLHAIVLQSYESCVGSPCRLEAVPVGSYLPAVPKNAVYGSLTWTHAPLGFSATLETQGRAEIFADDRNSAAAAAFWVENLRLGWQQERGRWHYTEFVRVDNLTNRHYVDSVIVNDSNARYFEPDPGRTAMILFTASRRNQ
jgi:iron complex outermembrane receptor protein